MYNFIRFFIVRKKHPGRLANNKVAEAGGIFKTGRGFGGDAPPGKIMRGPENNEEIY